MGEPNTGDMEICIRRILECTTCLDFSRSPIQNCVNGHIVCGFCLRRGPSCAVCRGKLAPCAFAERLAKHYDVKVLCKNLGCKYLVKSYEIDYHETAQCDFRKFFCFICDSNLTSYRNSYHVWNFHEHLTDYHLVPTLLRDNKGLFISTESLSGLDERLINIFVSVLIEYDGLRFIIFTGKHEICFYWCVCVLGSREDAHKYEASITLRTPTSQELVNEKERVDTDIRTQSVTVSDTSFMNPSFKIDTLHGNKSLEEERWEYYHSLSQIKTASAGRSYLVTDLTEVDLQFHKKEPRSKDNVSPEISWNGISILSFHEGNLFSNGLKSGHFAVIHRQAIFPICRRAMLRNNKPADDVFEMLFKITKRKKRFGETEPIPWFKCLEKLQKNSRDGITVGNPLSNNSESTNSEQMLDSYPSIMNQFNLPKNEFSPNLSNGECLTKPLIKKGEIKIPGITNKESSVVISNNNNQRLSGGGGSSSPNNEEPPTDQGFCSINPPKILHFGPSAPATVKVSTSTRDTVATDDGLTDSFVRMELQLRK